MRASQHMTTWHSVEVSARRSSATAPPTGLPYGNGIQRRAAELERLRADVHRLFDARDGTEPAQRAWSEAAKAFGEALRSFYRPYDLGSRIRSGDRAAIDDAVRFLEADPWCFRSGYVKAELMGALANCRLPGNAKDRLRRVVMHRVMNPEPRLGRPVGQLAHNVWDESLASQVRAAAEHGTEGQRDAALAMGRAVEHKRQTLAGRITKDGR